MRARPDIFISATSKDLFSCRQMVRDALLTLGCVPVTQDHFAPDTRTVREMLRARIAACDAVVHIAGLCYGTEPRAREPGEARRSYTQMEYDIASELKKPIYTFICAEDYPYDAHEPEDEASRLSQQAHRAALQGQDRLYLVIHTTSHLERSVRELQARVEHLGKALEKSGRRLHVTLLAGIAVLLLVAGGLWLLGRQGGQVSRRTAEIQRQSEEQKDEITRLRQQLEKQTNITERILAKVEHAADGGAPKSDPAAAAQSAVAREQGLTLEELRKRIAGEGADVLQLVADIDHRRTAALSQAGDWTRLQRDALTKLGDTASAAGRFAASIAPYQQALALCDPGSAPLVWCSAAEKLEYALWQMGRYAEAEPLVRQLVARRTSLQGKENPATLTSINNAANLLLSRGDYAGAEPLYRQVLEARSRLLGASHPDTLNTLGNLGILLDDKGDYTNAEPLLRRVLEERERLLGKEHPDTLKSVSNLANLLSDEGNPLGAESLYRRALEAGERTLGREHPVTLSYVYNLGLLLNTKGELPEAETLLRRALDAQERTLGREHPDTLDSVSRLADLLVAKNDLVGAEELCRRALEAQERILGRDSSVTLVSVNTLAALLVGKGDLAAAEPLYRRVLDARERTLGPDHPSTLSSVSNLAQLLDARGDLASAESLYLRAQAGMERLLPPEDLNRLDLDYYFSLMCQKQGRLNDALVLARHAADGAHKVLPDGNPDRVKYEKNFGDLQARLTAEAPRP